MGLRAVRVRQRAQERTVGQRKLVGPRQTAAARRPPEGRAQLRAPARRVVQLTQAARPQPEV